MRSRASGLAAAVLGFWAAGLAAQAAESETPFALYEKGDYAAAARAGEAADDAAGLALAARASLAEANLRETPCLPCLQKVEALARRSIAKNPHQTEGQVYLAVTLGYEARIVGLVRARFANYAEQAKQALDAAFAADPEDAWSLAGLGGWNIEVVHSAGSLLAKALYGATVDAGVADFKAAFAEEPDNPVLRFQYALSLSAVDFDRWRGEIAAALRAASMMSPRGAYEKIIAQRAAALLEAMKGDRRAYLALAAAYQGYP